MITFKQYLREAINTKTKSREPVPMKCAQCSKSFKSANVKEPVCPNCGSWDIDLV